MICMIAAMAVPGLNVMAAANGTLTLVCRTETTILSGMKWDIYSAAERDSEGELQLVEPFSDYSISFEDKSVSGFLEVAKTMENYVVVDNISPLKPSQTSDANGELSFTGLDVGLYLLVGQNVTIDDITYIPSPMLVEMTEEGETVIDLLAYPKFTLRPTRVGTEEVLTMKKVWNDDDNLKALRPTAIKVEIYRNGELFDNVELTAENDWFYSWTGDPDDDWRIIEREIPVPYTVIYKMNDVQYVVENTISDQGEDDITTTTTTTTTTTITTTTTTGTGSDDEETSASTTSTQTVTTTAPVTTTTKKEDLPQTGQLWWPVPVLGIAGILFFVFGWQLSAKSKDEEQ